MKNEFKEPEKVRVYSRDLEVEYISYGGYPRYKYNGEPFTGFEVVETYDNGVVCYEEEYKNGEHEGWEILYYENGKVKEEELVYGETPIGYREYNIDGKVTEETDVMMPEDWYKIYLEKGGVPWK